jgi:hypothetical protein
MKLAFGVRLPVVSASKATRRSKLSRKSGMNSFSTQAFIEAPAEHCEGRGEDLLVILRGNHF